MAHLNTLSPFISSVNYLIRQQSTGYYRVGMQLINNRFEQATNMYSKDLYAHYGCVNAIEFSDDGEWLASGGDDKRVLIWNVDKTLSGDYSPKLMKGEHNSNIFCLSFSNSHTKLYSAGNDRQVILHDASTCEILDVFQHNEAVYSLSVDPVNENIFASACDDGRVLIWDIRETINDPFVLCAFSHSFHAVMYNPAEPRLIATANTKEGIGLWDIRKPNACLLKYGESLLNQGAMSIRFNSAGTHLLTLRRRLPPVLYEISSANAVAEFDHHEYYNSCTMKSCCFAGENDQFVLSGSDDFKLYMWKRPENVTLTEKVVVTNAHLVLRSHRSIVNQVRYNSVYGMLASSGVEKVVKLWSTFPISQNDSVSNYMSLKDSLRKVYSHEEYIDLVLESGQLMSHDYSNHSVQEDPHMLALFDSLVQRDIEGSESNSSESSTVQSPFKPCFEVQSSESSSFSSSLSSSDEEEMPRRPAGELTLCNEHLTPRALMCLPSVKGNGTNVQDYLMNNPVEKENINSVDKISKLISQKRHIQKLKFTKQKLRKKCLYNVKKDFSVGSTFKNALKQAPFSNHFLPSYSHGKDNRKLLCKKRAKLYQSCSFSALCSDSDDNDSRSKTINDVQLSDKEQDAEIQLHPIKLENSLSTNDLDHVVDNSSSVIDDYNIPSGSHCLNKLGIESNKNNSNSLIFFQSKKGKNNRNYRKQNFEDLPDD